MCLSRQKLYTYSLMTRSSNHCDFTIPMLGILEMGKWKTFVKGEKKRVKSYKYFTFMQI